MVTKMPRLRFALAGIFHETNTYATEVTGTTPLSAFQQYRGAEIEQWMSGTNTAPGGYIEGARRNDIDLIFTYYAIESPSATIDAGSYAQMRQEVLEGIRAVLPLDGVLLALHGAGVAEGIDDIEGDLLDAVRELVGPKTPIAAAYDLHGNMSDKMQRSCDITLPCRLYPHTDQLDRSVQAVELLAQVARGELRPVTSMRRLPMLPYLVPTSPGSVTVKVNELCHQLSIQEGVIDCSWFHGFPYADIAQPCPVVLCITNGDEMLAQRCADEVATWIWNHREEFRPEIVSPGRGVMQALSEPVGPVIVAERSDNPGGGAPGDATHLLRALLDANPPSDTCCFGIINDKAVVEQAVKAGVGSTIRVSLGGKHGRYQGTPIDADAYVKALTDGKFVNRPGSMMAGYHFDLGGMCRLVINGVDVIVASQPQQVFDGEPFFLHGIDITRCRVVAIKGANHYRAGLSSLAANIISVDADGLCSTDIISFPRKHLEQPVWPLTEEVQFAGTAELSSHAPW